MEFDGKSDKSNNIMKPIDNPIFSNMEGVSTLAKVSPRYIFYFSINMIDIYYLYFKPFSLICQILGCGILKYILIYVINRIEYLGTYYVNYI